MPAEREQRRSDTPGRSPSLAVAVCVCLSGAAALTYEIAWMRKASLVFGSTTYAVATVLAVFFGGLAVGNYAFGRTARRVTQPLRVYGLLEIGIGLFAAATPWLFRLTDAAYAWNSEAFHIPAALVSTLLVGLIILPPTVLMGGTLPLVVRATLSADDRITRGVGLVYGLNTLGAAGGCALCGFVLLRTIGVNASIAAAAIVSLAAGMVLIWFGGGSSSLRNTESTAPVVAPVTEAPRAAIVHFLFFLSGFAALGYEVLWTRFLSLLVLSSVESYTLTLTVLLLGMVLGSFLTAMLSPRIRHAGLAFGAAQVATGLAVLAVLLQPWTSWRFWLSLSSGASETAIIGVVLLVPAMLSGMSYPLAIRLVTDRADTACLTVGTMTGLNTLGGIVGSLLVGFAALPWLGMKATLLICTGISVAIGLAAWLFAERTARRSVRVSLAVAALAVWLLLGVARDTRLPEDLLAHGRNLVACREGIGSNLAVIRDGGMLRLEIDQLWQGDEAAVHQRMAAHLPALLHPRPQDVVVVGLGAGLTPSRFLMHDIRRLDCVEIEPELVRLLREDLPSPWLDDPRVRVIMADGRQHLARSSEEYDLISIEVGQIFRTGAAAFYTAEFYRIARSRLRPGGLICQFVPMRLLDLPSFRTVIATFCREFPESALWYNTSELLLIGSVDAPLRLRRERFVAIEENAALRNDLDVGYWSTNRPLNRPEVFLAGYLMGRHGLASLSQGASICRDDLPALEYASATTSSLALPTTEQLIDAIDRQVDITELIRKNLGRVTEAMDWVPDADLLADVEAIRAANLGENVASQRLKLASALALQERMVDAQRELHKAVRDMPEHADANRLLGQSYQRAGRYDAAVTCYRQSLDTRQDQPDVLIELGQLLELTGRRAEAQACFEQALQIDPLLVEEIRRRHVRSGR